MAKYDKDKEIEYLLQIEKLKEEKQSLIQTIRILMEGKDVR